MCAAGSFLQSVKGHSYPTLMMLQTVQHLQTFSKIIYTRSAFVLFQLSQNPQRATTTEKEFLAPITTYVFVPFIEQ